mgnify:CR=1 FL=1
MLGLDSPVMILSIRLAIGHGQRLMRGVKKQDLPQKLCLVCGRPFTWRKKWEKNWDSVKYCSDACRKKRQAGS